MKLIGRDREFETLARLFKKSSSSLVAVTGRRRIGKSRLIQEFGKAAPAYFEVQGLAPDKSMTNQMQIDYFVKQMNLKFSKKTKPCTSWQEVFHYLAKQISETKKTVLFLDEISWMGRYDRLFPAVLKSAWDTEFKKKKNLVFVICGSVSSWIEDNILNTTDFLGRFSCVMNIEEIPLPQLPLFFGSYRKRLSTRDLIELFALTGGVPRYLEEVNPQLSVRENIHNLCFRKEGLFVSEFDKIFNDIFEAKMKTYKKIVMGLVTGRKTFDQVCKLLNQSRSGSVTKYLKDLVLSGFVAEDIIYSQGKAHKTKYYRLKDNYVRFYLKYLEPQKNNIQKGLFEYSQFSVLKNWSIIFGFQFENLILANTNLILKQLKINPQDVLSAGPYLQKKNSKNKGGCQIDLLIETKFHTCYVCEIKSQNKIDFDVVKEINTKVQIMQKPKQTSVQTVLIHMGDVQDKVIDSEQINHFISVDQLLMI
jgi:AAA+ ATPase superfamily predicted ATPase